MPNLFLDGQPSAASCNLLVPRPTQPGHPFVARCSEMPMEAGGEKAHQNINYPYPAVQDDTYRQAQQY